MYADSATLIRCPEESRRSKSCVIDTAGECRDVPELSRFYGITIAMFRAEHGVPHFHAEYAGSRISVEIDSGLVRGHFPPAARRLVLEWLALHRRELRDNWRRGRQHQRLQPIAPLE